MLVKILEVGEGDAYRGDFEEGVFEDAVYDFEVDEYGLEEEYLGGQFELVSAPIGKDLRYVSHMYIAWAKLEFLKEGEEDATK